MLAVGFDDAAVTASAAIVATLTIGPLVASLDGVGLRAALASGDRSVFAVGFKPPTGDRVLP